MTKIISFEGVDGVGKTTVINTLKDRLTSENKRVLVIQEPGTTQFGVEIRELIKKPTMRAPISDVLLFEAARADMVESVLKPAIKLGYDYILLDRYIDSTIAYQGYGNQNDLSLLEYLNNTVTKQLTPDKTILLTIPLEVANDRRRKRDEAPDRYENEAFLERVSEGYEALALRNPDRIVKVENIYLERTVDTIIKIITAPTVGKRETLVKTHQQAQKVATNVRYQARIGRFGRDYNDEPTMLLAEVTNKETGQIVTDHAWIDYTRELVRLGTVVPGDILEFVADVDTYEKIGRNGQVIIQYKLTNIREPQLIHMVPIPETDENFNREDLNRISTIMNDELFAEMFSRYFGFLCYISQRYFSTPETVKLREKGNDNAR